MAWRGICRVVPLLAVVLALPVMAADKQPTGIVTGDEFVDQLNGYRFEKLENWKFSKVDKEKPEDPRHIRFTATQSNFVIPENRKFSQENFNPPEIGLWVDTSSLTVEQFAEELKSRKSKLKARRDIGDAFRFLSQGEFQEQLRIQLDGIDGISLQYNYKYQAQLRNAANDTYKLVDEVRLGDLYFVKYAGKMIVLYYSCERPTYRQVKEEVEKMILAMKIKPPVKTTDTTGSAG